jgi:hypothetical protein
LDPHPAQAGSTRAGAFSEVLAARSLPLSSFQ